MMHGAFVPYQADALRPVDPSQCELAAAAWHGGGTGDMHQLLLHRRAAERQRRLQGAGASVLRAGGVGHGAMNRRSVSTI